MEKEDYGRLSFIFYNNWRDQLELMEDAQVRQFVYNLISWHKDEEIVLNTKLEQAVWHGVLPGLEANKKKWLAKAKASRKNGQLGGRPPKEKPKEPTGFSENPENLLNDNSKEVSDNSKMLNDNGKKKIEKREELIENSKQTTGKSKLSMEEIEELVGDSEKLKEYLDKRVGGILLLNNSIQEQYNPENIGEDIVDDIQISSFSFNIHESWNSNNKFSKKIEELQNIGHKIHSIFFNTLTGKVLELMNKKEFDKIPQFKLTSNNLKLFQLLSNIQFFLYDVKKIEEKMNSSSF